MKDDANKILDKYYEILSIRFDHVQRIYLGELIKRDMFLRGKSALACRTLKSIIEAVRERRNNHVLR